MEYSKRFGLRDLLSNPKLSGVFPQTDPKQPFSDGDSDATVERRVLQYLASVFRRGRIENGGIVVRGKKTTVMRQAQALAPMIEQFFNNVPSLTKNIRGNTKLYLPYATLEQVGAMRGVWDKTKALKAVLDNLNYNPAFHSENSVKSNSPISYQKRQEAWKRRVGYKD